MQFDWLEQILLSGMLVIPALALLCKPGLFPRLPTVWLFLTCCVAVYAMILARVYLIDTRFEAELAAFDLDGDGSFAGGELTPFQDAAMLNVVSDTGRALAPLTGLILSPLLVALAFGIVTVVRRVRAFLLSNSVERI